MTKSDKLAQEVARSTNFLKKIVESAPNGILIVNKEGHIGLVNRQIEKTFGYSREELIGKPMDILVPKRFRSQHSKDRRNFFGHPSSRSMGAGRDLCGLRKDGREIPVEIGLNPIETADGVIVLAAIIDITKRKQMEEELKKANEELERLSQIKSFFASMVSHELKTPLSSIKEGLQLILDGAEGPVNEAQKTILGIAKESVDRLARLANNVLGFSQLEAGKMKFLFEKTMLNKLLAEVYGMMKRAAEKKKIDFVLILPEEAVSAVCDRDKIKEVIINLVDNAIKFTDQGKISIRLESDKNRVAIRVEDAGSGIKKENLDKIFEGMHRRGGSGLGLAICRQIITEHKGTISVKSIPGKGSKFSVVFPSRI